MDVRYFQTLPGPPKYGLQTQNHLLTLYNVYPRIRRFLEKCHFLMFDTFQDMSQHVRTCVWKFVIFCIFWQKIFKIFTFFWGIRSKQKTPFFRVFHFWQNSKKGPPKNRHFCLYPSKEQNGQKQQKIARSHFWRKKWKVGEKNVSSLFGPFFALF